MQKLFVLGSNSFSGATFIDYALNNFDGQIFGFSRSLEKHPVFLPYKNNPRLKNFHFSKADFNTDLNFLLSQFEKEKPDYVVNFSAQSEVAPSWINPQHWYQTNVMATHELLFQLRNNHYIKKWIHTSSPEVYGTCVGNILESAPLNPSTPYAASKAAGDLALMPLIKQFKLPIVFMRSTNIYGAHQQLFKIIPRSILAILNNKTIELHGGGVAVKSYLHSFDIAQGTYLALLKGRAGEIYHLSPTEGGISVRDIVQQICHIMGEDFKKRTVAVAERPGQDAAYTIDSSKAAKELSWRPEIKREQGLLECIDWVKNNFSLLKNFPHEYEHKA